MRGSAHIKKREISPDTKYNSTLVAELINKILKDGYKDKATKIVYDAMSKVETTTKKPALEVLETGVKLASPQVEVKSKRIGGANYQVPMEVAPHRKIDLVFRWLITSTRGRHGKDMVTKLSEEMLAMYKGEGAVVKKRDDVHRMAEANKAFAHFARF